MSEENKPVSLQQALDETLTEMEAMSPEQLRAELDKHKDGPFAVAMREASEFIGRFEQEKSNATKAD